MRAPRSLLVLLAALALVVAACGGGGGSGADGDVTVGDPEGEIEADPEPADAGELEGGDEAQAVALAALIAASPDRLAEASTARLSMTFDMSGFPDVPGGAASFGAEGAFDLETGNGTMTMDMSALGIPGFAGAIEMRIVDQVVYMDFSAFADAFGGADLGPFAGVQWLSIDPLAMAEDLGVDPSELGLDTGPTDFTQTFDMLRDISSSVTEVGREDVRGVSTTHYRVEIDAQKAMEQGLGQLPDDLAFDAQAELDALGLGTIPADVWIDDDGLLHRMQIDFAFGDMFSGDPTVPGDAGFSMTLELFDFGVAVDVEPPPADQVLDMSEMLGGFAPGLGA